MQAERGRQDLSALPLSGVVDLVSLGWASPCHATATGAGLRRAHLLERAPHQQDAAAAPSAAAQQLPSPAQTPIMAPDVTADMRIESGRPVAAPAFQTELRPSNHAVAAHQCDTVSHGTPPGHDRPANLLEALFTMDGAAVIPGAPQPVGQDSQPVAAQRPISMATSATHSIQGGPQAAREGACFSVAHHTMPAAAFTVPEAAHSDAFTQHVQARPHAQALLKLTSACQAQPAAAGMQEAAAQPEQCRTSSPGIAAGQVLSQPAPGSEALMQPSSAAAMPLAAAAVGEGAAQPAAGSEETAQREAQPGPWRTKRKAVTQSPCTTQPSTIAAPPTLADGGTADAAPIQDDAPSDVQKPSAEQSQLQNGSQGDTTGSGCAQDTPAWLQDQVPLLNLMSLSIFI